MRCREGMPSTEKCTSRNVMSDRKRGPSVSGVDVEAQHAADEQHPDYVPGRMVDDQSGVDYSDLATPNEDMSAFIEIDRGDGGVAMSEQDARYPIDQSFLPYRPPKIRPGPQIPFPIRMCRAVSGRYRYVPPFQIRPPKLPRQPIPRLPFGPEPSPLDLDRPVVPSRTPGPLIPINLLRINVRVDVDRFFPQNRISIEVSRTFPRTSAHIIAEVTSDACTGTE